MCNHKKNMWFFFLSPTPLFQDSIDHQNDFTSILSVQKKNERKNLHTFTPWNAEGKTPQDFW